jgi:hypothetical protein
MAQDPLFDSAWFKWANALAHTQTLQADIQARAKADAQPTFAFRAHYEPKRHGFALVVATVEPIPVRWGLLLGDIANNYRASLDHLAWALVSRGRTPPGSGRLTSKQEKAVYFPVSQHRGAFNAELRLPATPNSRPRLPGVRRADSAKVRRRQPYHYSLGNRPKHALVLLADINNGDKHRTIQPIWVQPVGLDITVTDAKDCVVSEPSFGRTGQAIEVGAELAFMGARRTGAEPQINVQLGVAVEPSLGERLAVKEWLVRCGIMISQLLLEFSDQPPGIDKVGAEMLPLGP